MEISGNFQGPKSISVVGNIELIRYCVLVAQGYRILFDLALTRIDIISDHVLFDVDSHKYRYLFVRGPFGGTFRGVRPFLERGGPALEAAGGRGPDHPGNGNFRWKWKFPEIPWNFRPLFFISWKKPSHTRGRPQGTSSIARAEIIFYTE